MPIPKMEQAESETEAVLGLGRAGFESALASGSGSAI